MTARCRVTMTSEPRVTKAAFPPSAPAPSDWQNSASAQPEGMTAQRGQPSAAAYTGPWHLLQGAGPSPEQVLLSNRHGCPWPARSHHIPSRLSVFLSTSDAAAFPNAPKALYFYVCLVVSNSREASLIGCRDHDCAESGQPQPWMVFVWGH